MNSATDEMKVISLYSSSILYSIIIVMIMGCLLWNKWRRIGNDDYEIWQLLVLEKTFLVKCIYFLRPTSQKIYRRIEKSEIRKEHRIGRCRALNG